MNKNVKKVIAVALTISAFIAITPATNFNLMITKAYADAGDGITSLKIKSSSGNAMSFYDDDDYKSKNKIDNDKLESGKTYYAKTSSDEVEISVSGVDSSCVRVFKGTSDSDKGERTGSGISLSSSTTTIIVRVYSANPGSVKYGNDSYISQYRIKVKYTGSDDDEELENVYLKSITLSSGDIKFSKKTSTYDINVSEDVDEITIGARPDCDTDEYDDYKVKIDGTKVDEDDKYKDDVSLNRGKNVIEIEVEDDEDNERTYTLNITRGNITNSNDLNSGDQLSNIKSNQWVQAYGRWQYNDATGNVVKNSWVKDYYLQADGNMATYWLNNNGSWYYLGSDGAKKTGWQVVNGAWYYLDSQGKMQTGWMKDMTGKYYYLNSDGSMAYNTVIAGYKLGASGAWIK